MVNEYIRRQNISIRNRQFLTTYDWAMDVDFSQYPFYHPNIESLRLRTKDLSGINPTLEHNLISNTVHGYKLLQPGWTNTTANTDITLNLVDWEDQSIKYWFLDWQNKCDSITTHTGYRREDLMIDLYVWRLNSNQQKVWEMHYINCLPKTTQYQDTYETNNKQAVGFDGVSLAIEAEQALPTPLTTPLA
jgi:hypothetical protein